MSFQWLRRIAAFHNFSSISYSVAISNTYQMNAPALSDCCNFETACCSRTGIEVRSPALRSDEVALSHSAHDCSYGEISITIPTWLGADTTTRIVVMNSLSTGSQYRVSMEDAHVTKDWSWWVILLNQSEQKIRELPHPDQQIQRRTTLDWPPSKWRPFQITNQKIWDELSWLVQDHT